jgi:hypothetical protein
MEPTTDLDLLKKDFRNFLYVIWKHLKLPDPTPIQYEIAHFLQHGPKRQIISAFRGVGKSWITSAYVLWSLLNDPEQKFLIVSASKQRADDFSIFTQRLIKEVPFLQHLAPEDDQRSSKIAFDVGPCRAAHAPSVKSVGVFGQMTGSRATHIIADDVEVQNNSETEDKRDKLLQTVMEFEAIIMPEVGRITYLGTPQTEASVYNRLREKGYTARVWTARIPPDPEKYEGTLAPSIHLSITKGEPAGQATDPLRFNDIDLIEREAAYGRSGFALQFMLDTSLSDILRYPLKTADFIVMECNKDKAPVTVGYASGPQQLIQEIPNVGFQGDRFYRPLFIDKDWVPYEGSILVIDPSGRGKDETAYCVIKHLHGFLYVLAAGGFPGGYTLGTLEELSRLAEAFTVQYVLIESNFGDGMFTSLLQPVLGRIWPVTCEEVRHNIQKEKRIIDTLEPLLNQHRIVIDYDLVKKDTTQYTDVRYSLMYQLTHLTRDRASLKIDDRLDALAMGAAYWVESVARSAESVQEGHRARLLDEELQRFREGILIDTPYSATRPKTPKWC